MDEPSATAAIIAAPPARIAGVCQPRWPVSCSTSSIDGLLPTANRYGHSHEVLACIAGGMDLMAGSLLLLN